MSESQPDSKRLRRRRLTALWLARMVPVVEDLLRRHQVARATAEPVEDGEEDPWKDAEVPLQGASHAVRALLNIHARPNLAQSHRHYGILLRLYGPAIRQHLAAGEAPDAWQIVAVAMDSLEADLPELDRVVETAESQIRLEEAIGYLHRIEEVATRLEAQVEELAADVHSEGKLARLEQMFAALSNQELEVPTDLEPSAFTEEAAALVQRLAALTTRVSQALAETRQGLGWGLD